MIGKRTRLNIPEAIDLHRFFAPECDLSFGNCATAEVEKSRAVPKTRIIDSMAAMCRERHRAVSDKEWTRAAESAARFRVEAAARACRVSMRPALSASQHLPRARRLCAWSNLPASLLPPSVLLRLRHHSLRCAQCSLYPLCRRPEESCHDLPRNQDGWWTKARRGKAFSLCAICNPPNLH